MVDKWLIAVIRRKLFNGPSHIYWMGVSIVLTQHASNSNQLSKIKFTNKIPKWVARDRSTLLSFSKNLDLNFVNEKKIIIRKATPFNGQSNSNVY